MDQHPPRLQLPLKKSPPMVRPAIMVLGGVVFVAVGLAGGLFATAARAPAWTTAIAGALAGALAGLALTAVLWRRLTRSVSLPPIVVHDDHLVLPRHAFSSESTHVPLVDVIGIERLNRGKPAAYIIFATPKRNFPVLESRFDDADSADKLHAEVLAALEKLPDGAARVAALKRRDAENDRIRVRRPAATIALLVVLVGAFMVEIATDALSNPDVMVRLGANAPGLVDQGQWWRLVSGSALHAAIWHLVANVVALTSFGPLLERIVGTRRFLAAALWGGLIGAGASALNHDHTYSVGASTIVFALLGALVFVNVRHNGALPPSVSIPPRRWVSILGLNAFISLLPGVDLLAHLGGLLGGAAVAFALAGAKGTILAPAPRAATAAAVSAVAVFVTGLGAAAVHGLDEDVDHTGELLHAVFTTSTFTPEHVNRVAWRVAIDPSSKPAHLDSAVRAQRAIVEKVPTYAYFDTLAWLLQRTGDFDGAVTYERAAASKQLDDHVLTSVVRFLSARRNAAPVDATIIRQGNDLVVDTNVAGAAVYARVVVDGPAVGSLCAILPRDSKSARTPSPADLPTDAALEVLLVDGTGPETRTDATQLAWFPLNEKVMAYP